MKNNKGIIYLILFGILCGSCSAVVYNVERIYKGQDLINTTLFDFITIPDPTNGNVQYLSKTAATNAGLLNVTNLGNGNFRTTIRSARGNTATTRKSVRTESRTYWNKGLFTLDLQHMPYGCSTWPAWWMFADESRTDWPEGGEIDVLEGVNNQVVNAMALHTKPGCQMSHMSTYGNGNVFSGQWSWGMNDQPATNCAEDPTQWEGQGCSIEAAPSATTSYGAGLNRAGGGIYALEITDAWVKIFWFPRSSGFTLGSNPDPDTWGLPQAKFEFGANCPKSYFYNLQLTLDLTFCGDWAGGDTFTQMCGGDCGTYISNNHATLDANAYWEINSMGVYQVRP